ncbi:glycosyltransferase family 2 protein [Lysobacter sp. H23M47]|nr:glycosyltransferase family 2 protein [Lysobacter sp. H23M47]
MSRRCRKPERNAVADRLHRDNIVVVIPALNEALRIRDVVAGALRQCSNVIVVDDGSDDDTVARIAALPVTVLRNRQRLGKGASLRRGFQAALAAGASAVLTMDGDGQHLADDIPRLLEAGNLYPGHIVIGARLRRRSQQPRYRRAANAFADWGIAWGTGYQIADTQSGQRLYPAEVAALDDVPGEDFVFEAQILISAARMLGTRCVSVPIESRYAAAASASGAADDTALQFRRSHFRPLRDFTRITSHVVGQCWDTRRMPAILRQIRANPALIHDPSGDFDSLRVARPHVSKS